jgi:hypothetical protein
MTVQIDRLAPYQPLAASSLALADTPPRKQPDAARPVTAAQATGTIVGEVPPAPTAEARELVDRAAERVDELYAQNRELHFTRAPDSNRVVIEVRDLDGNVIKTIPPAQALDIMSGGKL